MSNELFKGYSFELENNRAPVAVLLPAEQEAVVGSIIKLDGRSSTDPENSELTYIWSFKQVPVGSQVSRFGFTNLETDGSIVSFAPDLIGPYEVQLVVSDGGLESDPAIGHIDVRVILVPHHTGFIPETAFIWNYLSDFWKLVEGRKRFETFWSAAVQIVASQMLKLYQYDYNKSIRDIQDVIQRRWLSYEPGLELVREEVKFILTDDQASVLGLTFVLDPKTWLPISPQPEYSNQFIVPLDAGDFSRTPYEAPVLPGKVLRVGDRGYKHLRSAVVNTSTQFAVDGYISLANPIYPFGFPEPPLTGPTGPIAPGPPGPAEFLGTGFTSEMIGRILSILSGPNAGQYRIVAILSEHAMAVVNLDGTGPTFVEDAVVSYTIYEEGGSHSAFFTDIFQVHGNLQDIPWRFSSTVISTSYDFEKQGVTEGDVLEVEVTRLDLNLRATIYGQVVSVDRDRFGFVMNLSDLVDGVPGGWFTQDAQASLASDLQISGLLMATDGTFVYSKEAGVVNSTVNSVKFKKTYFEKILTPSSEIDVGAFKISVRPVQVLRNKRIPVSDRLVSTPVLQEYIKQPTVIENDDTFTLVTEGGQVTTTRKPYIVFENLDYIVDAAEQIAGTCNLTAGVDEIEIPYGDLFDRSLLEHDDIIVSTGALSQIYNVRRVLSAEKIRVYPTPTQTSVGAQFKISRRVEGKFLRFVSGVFTKTNPAPPRLWGEVSYFDNNDAVEGNFGILVGVTQEDLKRANAAVPYKSAVAGLMYALSNGPVVSNLSLATQILLGLPFTLNAGVITEINPDYRKRDDGSPLYGRVLVEARDKNNKSIGLTNIYLYPHGRQIEDPSNPGQFIPAVPDFSGLAINPDTGNLFAVGDVVSQFTVLSKGIVIQEYLSTPDWPNRLVAQGDYSAIIRKYHSVQLLMNSDLVSASDIDFVAQFIRQTKPHYTKFTSALYKSVEEFVEVEESLAFGRRIDLFEAAAGFGVPSAVKFDDRDEDMSFLSVEGTYYTRYLSGTDLETSFGSAVVTTEAGGLVDPRPSLVESHDKPFIRPGDLLVIDGGPNNGRYYIDDVVDDQTLELAGPPSFESATIVGTCDVVVGSNQLTVSAGGLLNRSILTGDVVEVVVGLSTYLFSVTRVLSDTILETLVASTVTGTGVAITIKRRFSFRVYRPLVNPIWVGKVDVTTGDGLVATQETVGTEGGIGSAGVAVGDLLVFSDLSSPTPAPSQVYTIIEVVPDPVSPYCVIFPDPTETTGNYDAWVVRDGLTTKTFVEPYGTTPVGMTLDTVAFSNYVTAVGDELATDWLNLSLVRPGDVLFLTGETIARTVIRVEAAARRVLVTPPPSTTGTVAGCRFERPYRASVPVSVDFLDRIPGNYLVLDLILSTGSSDSVGTSVGSPDVVASLANPGDDAFDSLGVIPGDYAVILEGPDSIRDVGYGVGVFVIQEPLSALVLRLADNMTSTGNYRFGIRRSVPNEG
jgi:hypothetical protein